MARNMFGFLFLKTVLPLNWNDILFSLSFDGFPETITRMVDDGIPINEREVFLLMRSFYSKSGNDDNSVRLEKLLDKIWAHMTGIPLRTIRGSADKSWVDRNEIPCDIGSIPTLSSADIEAINTVYYDRYLRLSFLHDLLPLRHRKINEWIFDDEFATEIEALIKDGFHIDSRIVFLIMRRIYLEKEKKREENPQKFDNFDFKIARSGIVSLWENLTGSREGWRDGEI